MEDKNISRLKVIERFTERAQGDARLGAVLQMHNDHANRYRDYTTKRIIQRYLQARATDVALDFGCGVGRVSRYLADKCSRVEAVDFTPAMIESAQKNFDNPPNIRYQVISGNTLPFDDNSVDRVFTFWVLQHSSDADVRQLLREFKRVLTPNGRIVLFEQTRNHQYVYEDWNIHRTMPEYAAFGEDAGLKLKLQKHVLRNPSRGMAIWKKLNVNIPALLPLLYRLDNMTVMHKPEHVEYFTSAVVFEK